MATNNLDNESALGFTLVIFNRDLGSLNGSLPLSRRVSNTTFENRQKSLELVKAYSP
jgi:hypothetical protein